MPLPTHVAALPVPSWPGSRVQRARTLTFFAILSALSESSRTAEKRSQSRQSNTVASVHRAVKSPMLGTTLPITWHNTKEGSQFVRCFGFGIHPDCLIEGVCFDSEGMYMHNIHTCRDCSSLVYPFGRCSGAVGDFKGAY